MVRRGSWPAPSHAWFGRAWQLSFRSQTRFSVAALEAGSLRQATSAPATRPAVRSTPGERHPSSTRLFPADAALLHPRMVAKYRAGDPNAAPVERALLAHGAPARGPGEERGRYLDRLLRLLTVPFPHAGLHRYAFIIGPHRGAVRVARPALPYPGRAQPAR